MPPVDRAASSASSRQSAPLAFPWSKPPSPGEVTEVAPGILWARMPLPFRLNHVNVWLIEEDDGWTVIDTGCATPEIYRLWDDLFAGPMGGRAVKRVVATHGHVDHIGLTGWMVERFDSDFVGTFTEWMWARISHTHDVPRSDSAHREYLIRNGFAPADADELVHNRAEFMDLATPLPGFLTEIRGGDTIRLGSRKWQVIVTGGHAHEHASFHDPDSGILIAGDHLLPKISPVIAVYEMLPKADPLGDYLSSFAQFDGVADGTLILPSHGSPYIGIRERIAQLGEHHRERLEATAKFLAEPSTGLELSKKMFPKIEGVANIGFALGETLAHINHLVHLGVVADVSGEPGISRYKTKA